MRPRRGGRLCAARRHLAGHEDRRRGRRTRARARKAAAARACSPSWRVVSLWTPLAFERIAERWFSTPNILLPLAGADADRAGWRSVGWRWLERRRRSAAFFASIGLFLLGYLGLVISVFPYLVPPSLTIWDTAAAPASQIFMLIGTLCLLPIILGYVVFMYWLFRGKVREGESYH